MNPDFKVEFLSAEEVAKILHTTAAKIRAAILNGTLPIGVATEGGDGERTRIIIVKRRFELWINGADLGGK